MFRNNLHLEIINKLRLCETDGQARWGAKKKKQFDVAGWLAVIIFHPHTHGMTLRHPKLCGVLMSDRN